MTSSAIGVIYDRTNEGILPPSVELEAFNTELNEIPRPLKKRTDFEKLVSIYYDMAVCTRRYDSTCGFKQGIGVMVERMTWFREEG